MNTTYGNPDSDTHLQPAAGKTVAATVGGVLVAAAILMVVPRILLIVHAPQIVMQLLLAGCALGSPAIWLTQGRKTPLGAFGFAATMVVVGFVLIGLLLYGFVVALFSL